MKTHHIPSFLRSCGEPEMAEAKLDHLLTQRDELLVALADLKRYAVRARAAIATAGAV